MSTVIDAGATLERLAEVAAADLVVTCTGSTGVLVTTEMVAGRQRPLAVVDLALPHDVEPEVSGLPGVTLVTLADLAEDLHGSEAGVEVEAVPDIVTQEVAAFLVRQVDRVVAVQRQHVECVERNLRAVLLHQFESGTALGVEHRIGVGEVADVAAVARRDSAQVREEGGSPAASFVGREGGAVRIHRAERLVPGVEGLAGQLHAASQVSAVGLRDAHGPSLRAGAPAHRNARAGGRLRERSRATGR